VIAGQTVSPAIREVGMKRRGMALVASFAVVVVLVLALPASAQTRAKVTQGACANHSTWTLTLKWDNGRIETDIDVHTLQAGQLWKSAFRDNGVVFAHASKTSGPDGSWSATRFAPNQAGTDAITVRATNTVTGEVCRASGSF
jgi:hypothetical protein